MNPPMSVIRERSITIETYRFFCKGLRTINLRRASAIPAINYVHGQNAGEQTQEARIVRIGFEARLRMLTRFESLFRREETDVCSYCSHPFIQRVMIRCQRADFVSCAGY